MPRSRPDSADGKVRTSGIVLHSWPMLRTDGPFPPLPRIRSVLDEDHDLFGGTYAGANSLPAVKEEVESADFVLMAGKLESDFK
jgi:TPP-dependent 2-oxoacid decarboxylase